MNRIGLLEIKCSNHALSGLCEISNTNECNVTVFTIESIFSQIKEELEENISAFEWIIKGERENTGSFLKRIEKICNKRIDLLIINSIRNWEFLFFNPKCKKIFWIYSVKSWFKPINAILAFIHIKIKEINFFKNIITIKENLQIAISRKFILPKYDGIIVEYSPLKNYIQEYYNYEKGIYIFPNWPAKDIKYRSNNKKIRFIVPGNMSKNRRNYEIVLRVFEDLFNKHNESIELFLLGKPQGKYGKIIISICKKLKDHGHNIFYFEEYIPYDNFKELFINSDMVIAPLNLKYESGYINELYSITKGTGVTSDCIKYGKPLVVPKEFKIAEEFKTSFLKYKDEKDLRNMLETFICERKKLESLKDEALINSGKFSLEKLQKNFNMMVEELLIT